MNWLKENWFKLIIVLILIFGFYWLEWRPKQARVRCTEEIKQYYRDNKDKTFSREEFNFLYKYCLTDKGLKE